MVDEQLFEVGLDLLQPAFGGGALQIQHAAMIFAVNESGQWQSIATSKVGSQ